MEKVYRYINELLKVKYSVPNYNHFLIHICIVYTLYDVVFIVNPINMIEWDLMHLNGNKTDSSRKFYQTLLKNL